MINPDDYWKVYMGDTPHTLECRECGRIFWTGFHKYSNGICKNCKSLHHDEWIGLEEQMKSKIDYGPRFNREVMFSSKSGDWNTPKDLYNWLDGQFNFTFDPCTTEDNPLGAPKFCTPKEDGLKQSWAGERVYVNPPYGRIYPHWVKKAYKEVTENHCELVVMLLPARTDTIIFHDYCIKGDIWFLKGRLHFSGHKNAAPFPSMIVIFKNEED